LGFHGVKIQRRKREQSRKDPSGIVKRKAFHPGEIGSPKAFHRAGGAVENTKEEEEGMLT